MKNTLNGSRLAVSGGAANRTPNTEHRILIFVLICGLLTIDYGLLFSQDDYLNIKGSTKANTITFAGNLTDYPAAPLEGEVFYNSQDKLPKYFDATTWKNFGGPKTTATRVVAASDTPNAASRADYVCTGTNDQVTIQQAIDALGANPGAVYLLEGTYNISASINLNTTLDDSGKAIIGTGRGTVLKKVSDGSFRVIVASSVNRILISQLMIDGSSIGASQPAISFSLVTYSKIDKVWIENVGQVGCSGIYLSASCNNNVISNNNIQNNSWDGIEIRSSSNNNIISHNNIQSNYYMGIYVDSSCNNNIISNNNLQSNGNTGIFLTNSCSNNIISNNNVQNNTNSGIFLARSSNNIISQNNVQGNKNEGICLTYTPASSNNVISNNNIQGNSYNGIYLSSAKNNTITGNIIYDNGGTLAYDGIKLGGDFDSNLISSNRISDSAGTGYGINISANTCDNNYLVGNLIDGAGYAGRLIQDLGTGTKYTDKAKMTLERNISTSSTLDAATSPRSYVALNPTGTIILTLSNGKSTGDLLILENISTNTVTINDSGNVNLGEEDDDGDGNYDKRTLQQYDILRLIWNGSRWLETEYVNN